MSTAREKHSIILISNEFRPSYENKEKLEFRSNSVIEFGTKTNSCCKEWKKKSD